MDRLRKAKIVLEDGVVFEGFSFGAAGERYGEIVFNTSMAGYQEILTDPSYKGQIVIMTYPLIGNYGINLKDVESRKPFIEGFIVKEYSRIASNWRSQKTLDTYLKENDILGITAVDTRALTRHIRLRGAMRAVISTEDLDETNLVKKAKASFSLIGRDLVKEVTTGRRYMGPEFKMQNARLPESRLPDGQAKFKIIILDCGVKYSILTELVKNNCEVTVVPAGTTAEEILKMRPDGLLLSNGPGDPKGVPYIVETVKKLIYQLPIMGICLGHQILALAFGGRTYKLKFGHHGGNHPVKDLKTGKIAITVQNHGFCVDMDSLNKKTLEITHINLNDHTLEGMKHKELPIFSVQFHPESSPGPHDVKYLFHEFIKLMERNQKPGHKNQSTEYERV